jgi:DHA2 family multidrug resistance protein
MPVAAKLISRFDPRRLLVGGGFVLVIAILQLAQLTPQSGSNDFFWPLIIRSFGTVLMFLPLSMATLGPIPKEDVGKATGIFSLTRQLGGSIGVALLSSLLDGRMAFHRAVIAEKLVASDPAVQTRVAMYAGAFASRGSSAMAAKAQALAALDGTVRVQASVISFADTFWATAALVVCTLPLVFLLGKPKDGAKLGAGAH